MVSVSDQLDKIGVKEYAPFLLSYDVGLLFEETHIDDFWHTRFDVADRHPVDGQLNPGLYNAWLSLSMPKSDKVEISLCNLYGDEIETMDLGFFSGGTYRLGLRIALFFEGMYILKINCAKNEKVLQFVM